MLFKRSDPTPPKDATAGAAPTVVAANNANNATVAAAARAAPAAAAAAPAKDTLAPVATPAPPASGAPASAAALGTAPAPAIQRERQAATIRYIDRPDVAETFADAVSGLMFDGQTLRLEFAVTRLDEVKAGTPVTGRRYPVCRLALPPAAALDLINRVQQIGAVLAPGMAKPGPRPAEPTKAI